jgi:hypothetical protein
MSIDITSMSDKPVSGTVSGTVTGAIAHIRFVPFAGGPNAAVLDDKIVQKDEKVWEQWNTMIQSGNYEKRRLNKYTKKSGKILFRSGN